MKVRIRYGNVELEGEGDTQKVVFSQLAAMTEVFREENCGCCNNQNTIFTVRRVPDPKSKGKKEFEYYEKRCLTKNCGARLAYGQHNEGGSLFPKRKDEDGNYLPNRGWVKYEKEKSDKK
jgi:hypothetical protein